MSSLVYVLIWSARLLFSPPFSRSEDDVNIIVFVGWLWIGRVDLSVDTSCADDKDIRVIKTVQGALEVSLVRNIHPCRFLSGMHEIPPFETAILRSTGTPSFSSNHVSIFAGFPHVMVEYYQKWNYDLCIHHNWHEILENAHFNSHCTKHDCPWMSHSCDNVYGCPLLGPYESETGTYSSSDVGDVHGSSRPNDQPPIDADGEVAVHESFLNRCKTFWRRHLRLANSTDEESGGSPGNALGALVSDVVAVASGDGSAGGIAVGISHRASLSLVSEDTETTGLVAGGIPLVPLAACRSPPR